MLADMVAVMKFLEQICIPLLDSFPTIHWSSIRDINPVLREARGGSSGIRQAFGLAVDLACLFVRTVSRPVQGFVPGLHAVLPSIAVTNINI